MAPSEVTQYMNRCLKMGTTGAGDDLAFSVA